MSKIILAILSIFFFHCSYVFSIEVLPTNKETTEIKFLGNKIKFLDKNEKIFIEKINGKVEEYTYKNNVYIQSENGKIVKLLETFIFDNYGDFESRFRKIAKGIFYLSGPGIGCNESKKNLYHEIKDNGFSYINCISSKILNNKKEIFGPNLKDGWGNHLRLDLRAKKIKSIMDKNKLKTPAEMVRNEHYFYKNGQIIWIFFSADKKMFIKDSTKQEISNHINNLKKIHQSFEKKFRFIETNSLKFN